MGGGRKTRNEERKCNNKNDNYLYCELKEITETLKSEIQSTDDKYINFSDIDDEKYNVSEADKKFTKSFYNN